MKKVLITGANGFIGSHIVEQFVKEGVKVICLVRKTSNMSNLDTTQVELRYGDISDENSLIDSFKECDFIIHNASFVTDWGKYDSFHEANVVGTINVLNACLKNGIKNIVMTGSVSSYGEENCKKVKNENSGFNSHYRYFLHKIFPNGNNFYRDTKAKATINAMELAYNKGLNLTIIEPVWVYGEREFNTGFYTYIKAVKDGLNYMPGSKKNKFHVIYVGDLARAYYLTYTKKLKGINRIIIGNEKTEYMYKIYELFCNAAGIKFPVLIPKWMVYPIGFILELIYTVGKSKEAPLLTRSRVNMFYDNVEFSTKKAEKLLNFKNEYSIEKGIMKTIQWYKDNSLI
ncbi:MAG: NAD(P)-dependent oxidoreductase [Acidobacteria bacterium]|nr:NAD(P)-dependent oxidoreductase [Acidobacteriota bacterium]